MLADEFRAVGYDVELEKAYPEYGRRLDMEVRSIESLHRELRPLLRKVHASVELQDSPISPRVITRRKSIDQYAIGLNRTVWILIGGRAEPFLRAREGQEVRCGQEALALADGGDEIVCFDVAEPALWTVRLDPVIRPGALSPDRKLRSIRRISKTRRSFALFGQRADEGDVTVAMRSEGDFQRYRLAEALLDSRWLDGVNEKYLPVDSELDLRWADVEYIASTALKISVGERQQMWVRKTLVGLAAECPRTLSGRMTMPNRLNPLAPGALYLGCKRLLANNGVPKQAFLGHEACPLGGPPAVPRGQHPEGWPLTDLEYASLRKL